MLESPIDSQWPIDSEWDAPAEDLATLPAFIADLAVPCELFGPDGRCLYCNDECRELFGSAPPPEYNALEDDIAEREGVLDLIRRGFGGEIVRIPPIWYDPRDSTRFAVREGRRVAIETMVVPLRDGSGKVSQVAVIFKDRSRHEAPTMPAPSPIAATASCAAREISDPLSALLENLAKARDELATAHDSPGAGDPIRTVRARERLDDARKAADQIRRMLGDLALLARTDGESSPRQP
jgi:signal transduction histidine kinase